MDTNYYWKPTYTTEMKLANIQKVLNGEPALPPETLHIGKDSYGWQFYFQGTEEIRSLKDWTEIFEMNEGEIVDSYGHFCNIQDFLNMVKRSMAVGQNHYDYCKENQLSEVLATMWLDDEGYCFVETDFS